MVSKVALDQRWVCRQHSKQGHKAQGKVLGEMSFRAGATQMDTFLKFSCYL